MTDLQNRLVDIQKKLKNDAFTNEQSISVGIVLPVLQDLGWDIFQTDVVYPEYSTGEGRVDFALCEPPGKPRCFIEVKQPGARERQIDDAIKQLMSYAFQNGSQFAVLTDGQTWSFYLPAEPGKYEERRVFMLDLFEHGSDKASEVLKRYLLQQDVKSGETLNRAREDLHSANLRDKAKREIPNAWKGLVQERDPALINKIANECESKVGVRPENADVVTFLENLACHGKDFTRHLKENPIPTTKLKGSRTRTTSNSRKSSYIIYGQEHVCSTMKDVFIEIFTELARQDTSFLSRCATEKSFTARKRHIGRSKDEIHPNRPDLGTAQLPGGWFINTNTSNEQKIKLIKSACLIAGIDYGRELKINLPENRD